MITSELKIKIFGLYLDCNAIWMRLGKKDIIKITPFDLHLYNERILKGEVKLLLKPIRYIIDEDINYLINMFFPDMADCNIDLKRISILDYLKFGKFLPENIIFITDYLRSKGYMIPYMGIDLFKEELAINESC